MPEDPDADGPAAEPPPDRVEEEHRTDGLDLARSIARAYADPSARRPAARRASTPRRRRRIDPSASGAHPDDRDPQLLDSTMARLVAEHGWATDVRVHALFARWDQIVGAEIAQHCKPQHLTDGELLVQADSTAWATQMSLLASTVVRSLNDRLGDGSVQRIKVQGPQAPSWKRGNRRVKGRGPRDTYG
ncbi:MAG: DciA family protein [Nocardioidaceae bacterium]|nr:DciA family protein [Nocardioidaceae bacterium]